MTDTVVPLPEALPHPETLAHPHTFPHPETLAELATERHGMFVHWGVYAKAARHEWVKFREKMTDEQYQIYLDTFDPDLYDPAEWAEIAYSAGMRSAVLTVKHHDGFCLWDSPLTDYSVVNTPHGADLVTPFVDAFRARGMSVGLYYSLVDWHHPEFTIDSLHPRKDDPEFRAAQAGRDMSIYREYMHAQIEEVLTKFGPLQLLFFDYSYDGGYVHQGNIVRDGKGAADWGSVELMEKIRRLQPRAMVNDRLRVSGDYQTPEQYQPEGPMTKDGVEVPWVAVQTLNGSWGYDRDNRNFKPVSMIVRMLIDTVSKNGNLLLNVGPDGRGRIDPDTQALLAGLGEWMTLHNASIYDAGASAFEPPRGTRYTQRGNRLYLHIFDWPFATLDLPGLADRVRYAQFMHDGSEVIRTVIDSAQPAYAVHRSGAAPGTLTIRLPIHRPDVEVPVIELFLKE